MDRDERAGLEYLLRRKAREGLDELLGSKRWVMLPGGKFKSVMGLKQEEFDSLAPPFKSMARRWIRIYQQAERGYMHLGDGEFKHVDDLVLEDEHRLEVLPLVMLEEVLAALGLDPGEGETLRSSA